MTMVLFRSRLTDAADGERLAVIWWEDEETLRARAEDPRHREAQRLGRERWYASYRLGVGTVVRAYGFERR